MPGAIAAWLQLPRTCTMSHGSRETTQNKSRVVLVCTLCAKWAIGAKLKDEDEEFDEEEYALALHEYHRSSIDHSLRSLAGFLIACIMWAIIYFYTHRRKTFVTGVSIYEFVLFLVAFSSSFAVWIWGRSKERVTRRSAITKFALCWPVVIFTAVSVLREALQQVPEHGLILDKTGYFRCIVDDLRFNSSDFRNFYADNMFRLTLVCWSVLLVNVAPLQHACWLWLVLWAIVWLPFTLSCGKDAFSYLTEVPMMTLFMALVFTAMNLQISALRWKAAKALAKSQRILEKVMHCKQEFGSKCDSKTAAGRQNDSELEGSVAASSVQRSCMSAPAAGSSHFASSSFREGHGGEYAQLVCSSRDCLPDTCLVNVEGAHQPLEAGTLKVGQRILCYDHITGQNEFVGITEIDAQSAASQQNPLWTRVELQDGVFFDMTKDHPLKVVDHQSELRGAMSVARASELEAGRHSLICVQTRHLSVVKVTDLEQEESRRPRPVQLQVAHCDRYSPLAACPGSFEKTGYVAVGSWDLKPGLQITAKNTFIDATDTRYVRRSHSCPSSLRMEDAAPRQEKAREGTAAGSKSVPSIGSEDHASGKCVPCRAHYLSTWKKSKSGDSFSECRFGAECLLCHENHGYMTRAELQRRRREVFAGGVSSSPSMIAELQ
eukprot:TRINITY_DN170_c0_g1_i8.p1 TRINITY_DN170_c0_g1~~TRINITY_DN170_c0_g1_i8.p1  ORF type:complete len:661 (+),score=97.54 TRINITY_DN170_c0_g1_i8:49-2031(+)